MGDNIQHALIEAEAQEKEEKAKSAEQERGEKHLWKKPEKEAEERKKLLAQKTTFSADIPKTATASSVKSSPEVVWRDKGMETAEKGEESRKSEGGPARTARDGWNADRQGREGWSADRQGLVETGRAGTRTGKDGTAGSEQEKSEAVGVRH